MSLYLDAAELGQRARLAVDARRGIEGQQIKLGGALWCGTV